jgi:lantibiotic modifying enzyme
VAAAEGYREVGEAAWAWVAWQVQDDAGPWLPEQVPGDGPPAGPGLDRDSLYAGIAGLAPVLAEIRQHRALAGAERSLADRLVARLLAMVPARTEPSLYDGLAGDVTALKLLAPGSEQAALARLAELATPVGWSTTLGLEPGSVAPVTDLVQGSAGIVLAAVWAGAAHLLAVGTLDETGFVIPHTLPYSTRDVDPVTYNWCHGPAGTSQLFAALAAAGMDTVAGRPVRWLRQRCLDAILGSGVPQRIRPGFWDNDGRCCGTAGVGDILLDAAQDCADEARAGRLLQAAQTMADALVDRAIHHQGGAYWRFTEHRQDPPLLPPGTSWMQGAAGIAAFLLRMARVAEHGLTAPVVDRPDQWWGVPAQLRTVHPGAGVW